MGNWFARPTLDLVMAIWAVVVSAIVETRANQH